jgi:hypothetical protein
MAMGGSSRIRIDATLTVLFEARLVERGRSEVHLELYGRGRRCRD